MKCSQIQKIAIGSFDGVHLGHQRLISMSDGVVIIERGCGSLTHGYRRSHYINKPLFIYHFEKVRALTPVDFLKMLMLDFPHLKQIIVGYDFEFGYQKSGNAKVLQEIFDGEVIVIEEVMLNNISIHSRTIKELLKEGQIHQANHLLGRYYEMDGKIIKGQGLGTKKLVSTINMKVCNYQLPKEGVYASRIFVNSAWYDSISFIGHRASTDNTFAIETHIIDKEIELHSAHATLAWIEYIRPNQTFDTLDALKVQIISDIQQAKKIHNER